MKLFCHMATTVPMLHNSIGGKKNFSSKGLILMGRIVKLKHSFEIKAP